LISTDVKRIQDVFQAAATTVSTISARKSYFGTIPFETNDCIYAYSNPL